VCQTACLQPIGMAAGTGMPAPGQTPCPCIYSIMKSLVQRAGCVEWATPLTHTYAVRLAANTECPVLDSHRRSLTTWWTLAAVVRGMCCACSPAQRTPGQAVAVIHIHIRWCTWNVMTWWVSCSVHVRTHLRRYCCSVQCWV
jgi:hypothetical protein